MRIGIYLYTKSTGLTRYLRNLLESLLDIDRENRYVVYTDEPAALRSLRRRRSFAVRRFSLKDSVDPWQSIQRDLPRRIRQDRIDLFHTQFDCFPLDSPCRTVVTIHDAIPVLGPRGMFLPSWRRLASQQLLLAARLADHLIVPTLHVKKQMVEKLRIPPRRITWIHSGCDPLFRPIPRDKAARAVRRRFGLRRPYLLAVGELIPRKNVPFLIKAFRGRLREKADLVLAGKPGWWRGKEILRLAQGDRAIHALGAVPDSDLLNLYAAAECLVFPSLHEGFGFPPLEAMACGTPVVAMRSASIPEVVGKAGLLVEPGSARRLAGAIEALLEDARLRRALRQRGLRRARRFRWKDAAAKTLAVYGRVANGARSQSRL